MFINTKFSQLCLVMGLEIDYYLVMYAEVVFMFTYASTVLFVIIYVHEYTEVMKLHWPHICALTSSHYEPGGIRQLHFTTALQLIPHSQLPFYQFKKTVRNVLDVGIPMFKYKL